MRSTPAVTLVEVQEGAHLEPLYFWPPDFPQLLHRVRSGWRPASLLIRYADNRHHGRVVLPDQVPEFPTWLTRELHPS